MHRLVLRTIVAAALISVGTTVAACHHPHHSRAEGPAQHVGRNVDHAADRTGDVIEDTGRKVNRALPGD